MPDWDVDCYCPSTTHFCHSFKCARGRVFDACGCLTREAGVPPGDNDAVYWGINKCPSFGSGGACTGAPDECKYDHQTRDVSINYEGGSTAGFRVDEARQCRLGGKVGPAAAAAGGVLSRGCGPGTFLVHSPDSTSGQTCVTAQASSGRDIKMLSAPPALRERPFTDRSYHFTSMGSFAGTSMHFVQPPNSDKNTPADSVMWTLTVDVPVTIYLDVWGYDDHYPRWLLAPTSQWVHETAMEGTTFRGQYGNYHHSARSPGRVFSRTFAAGTIEIMGNGGNGHGTFYAFVDGLQDYACTYSSDSALPAHGTDGGWILGGLGESCATTCGHYGMTCSPAATHANQADMNSEEGLLQLLSPAASRQGRNKGAHRYYLRATTPRDYDHGRTPDIRMEIGGDRNWRFEGGGDRFNAVECDSGRSSPSTADWAPYLACSDSNDFACSCYHPEGTRDPRGFNCDAASHGARRMCFCSAAGGTQSTCEACPVGKFQLEEAFTGAGCQTCSICEAGQFLLQPCTATSDARCQDCPAGKFQTQAVAAEGAASCTACTPCGAGKVLASACSHHEDATCSDCPNGKFSTEDSATCSVCRSACPAGTKMTAQCTAERDSVCEACDPGQHQESDAFSGSECSTPSSCARGQYVVRAATATSDTECATCATGQFQSEADFLGRQCASCRTCGAGQYASADCTSADDRQCSACEDGHFQASDSSTATSCTPHSECNPGFTILESSPGTASTDVGCTEACTPLTATTCGLACGAMDDNCGGTLDCGPCPGSQRCEANACVCEPWTCDSQPLVCGEQTDGCGNPLDCGECPSGKTCLSGEQPGARPERCFDISPPVLSNMLLQAERTDRDCNDGRPVYTTVAGVGSVLVLTFESSEQLTVFPTVTLAGGSATVTCSGMECEARHTVLPGDAVGLVDVVVSGYEDAGRNPGKVERFSDRAVAVELESPSVISVEVSAPYNPGDWSVVHECTPGRYTGTQYKEDQTPTIEDCSAICAELGHDAFSYGNPMGWVSSDGLYTSDGGRSNDCICVDGLDFVSGWESRCRWNVYATGDGAAVVGTPATVTVVFSEPLYSESCVLSVGSPCSTDEDCPGNGLCQSDPEAGADETELVAPSMCVTLTEPVDVRISGGDTAGSCEPVSVTAGETAIIFQDIQYETRPRVGGFSLKGDSDPADDYEDALAAFNAADPGGAGYCSRTLDYGRDWGNYAQCGEDVRNIAFHYQMPFQVLSGHTGTYRFRFHADWGHGGVSCFRKAGEPQSPGGCTSWSRDVWGWIYFEERIEEAGNYEWESLGFEYCCDGWQELDVKLPAECGAEGASWTRVSSVSRVGSSYFSCPANRVDLPDRYQCTYSRNLTAADIDGLVGTGLCLPIEIASFVDLAGNAGDMVDSTTDGSCITVSPGGYAHQADDSLGGVHGCRQLPQWCLADWSRDCFCNGVTSECESVACAGRVYDACGCMTLAAASDDARHDHQYGWSSELGICSPGEQTEDADLRTCAYDIPSREELCDRRLAGNFTGVVNLENLSDASVTMRIANDFGDINVVVAPDLPVDQARVTVSQEGEAWLLVTRDGGSRRRLQATDPIEYLRLDVVDTKPSQGLVFFSAFDGLSQFQDVALQTVENECASGAAGASSSWKIPAVCIVAAAHAHQDRNEWTALTGTALAIGAMSAATAQPAAHMCVPAVTITVAIPQGVDFNVEAWREQDDDGTEIAGTEIAFLDSSAPQITAAELSATGNVLAGPLLNGTTVAGPWATVTLAFAISEPIVRLPLVRIAGVLCSPRCVGLSCDAVLIVDPDVSRGGFGFGVEEDDHRDPCHQLDTLGGSLCPSIDDSAWHSTISFSEHSRAEVCDAHVYTRGTTCNEFCESQGRLCMHAQDNTDSSCNLDGAHARQDVRQNGCNQNWNNQICGCSGPTSDHVWVPTGSGVIEEGPIAWSVSEYEDEAGNIGSDFGSTEDAAAIDLSGPTVVSLDVASTSGRRAVKAGDEIAISIVISPPLSLVGRVWPAAFYDFSSAKAVHSWQATGVLSSHDGYGSAHGLSGVTSEQTADGNCNCGNRISEWPNGKETVELCEAACVEDERCLSFGLWTGAKSHGYCALFDAPCAREACYRPTNVAHGFTNDNYNMVAGSYNDSVELDGTDDYLSVPAPWSDPDADFAVSMWVSVDSLTSGSVMQGIVGRQTTGICPGRSPSLFFNRATGGLSWDSCTSDGMERYNGEMRDFFQENVREWVYITWTKSGGQYLFAKNGELVGLPATAAPSVEIADDYHIGKVDTHFNGRLDEVAFFKRGLSADDINMLYHRDPNGGRLPSYAQIAPLTLLLGGPSQSSLVSSLPVSCISSSVSSTCHSSHIVDSDDRNGIVAVRFGAYHDVLGNSGVDAYHLSRDVVIDTEAPRVTSIALTSTGAPATYGDTITLQIFTSERIVETGTTTILGQHVDLVCDETTWTCACSYTIQVGQSHAVNDDGSATFSISGYSDQAGNIGASITDLDSSTSVNVDITPPDITILSYTTDTVATPAVPIDGLATDVTAVGVSGSIVTLSFSSSEAVGSACDVVLHGVSVPAVQSSDTTHAYTAQFQINAQGSTTLREYKGPYEDTTLRGCSQHCRGFPTLDECQEACDHLSDCSGCTYDGWSNGHAWHWELRSGGSRRSCYDEVSWVKTSKTVGLEQGLAGFSVRCIDMSGNAAVVSRAHDADGSSPDCTASTCEPMRGTDCACDDTTESCLIQFSPSSDGHCAGRVFDGCGCLVGDRGWSSARGVCYNGETTDSIDLDVCGYGSSTGVVFSGTPVLIDTIAPLLDSVSLRSSAVDHPSVAFDGSIVTLTLITSERIRDPVVQLAGHAMEADCADTTCTATFTVGAATESNGQMIEVQVSTIVDLVGNKGSGADGTSDGSGVTVNLVDLSLVQVSVSTNNANSAQHATTGDVVTLDVTASRDILELTDDQ
eukprot:COSAG02_NODE_357_length_23913_cov_6.793483_8_plen_2934_part_01